MRAARTCVVVSIDRFRSATVAVSSTSMSNVGGVPPDQRTETRIAGGGLCGQLERRTSRRRGRGFELRRLVMVLKSSRATEDACVVC